MVRTAPTSSIPSSSFSYYRRDRGWRTILYPFVSLATCITLATQRVFYLATLVFSDAQATLLNLFLPAQPYVPAAFSPDSPPSIFTNPIVAVASCIAQLGHRYGVRSRTVEDWLVWSGIGCEGQWGFPELPGPDERRSPCPALNAMSNHSILPFCGGRIRPVRLAASMSRAFNLSPTLSLLLLEQAGCFWGKTGRLSLDALCAQNVLEHDGSLLRPDQNSSEQLHDPIAQEHVWKQLVDTFAPHSFGDMDGEPTSWDAPTPAPSVVALSYWDLACALSTRRAYCRKVNEQYSTTLYQRLYSNAMLVLLLDCFDGIMSDIRGLCGGRIDNLVLHCPIRGMDVERFPLHEWQPKNRRFFGTTATEILVKAILLEILVLLCRPTDIPETTAKPFMATTGDKVSY